MSAPEPMEARGAALSIWRDAPSLDGARTAALGAFSCADAPTGAALIAAAVKKLAAEGFGAVIGPMDGDTWGRHRLVVESDASASFLMEPHNPAHYPAAFDEAGFDIVSRYVSAVAPASAGEPAPTASGFALLPFDRERAEQDLMRVYDLSLKAFAHNAFYRPISAERFMSAYLPFAGALDPDLAFFAVDGDGALAGFLFGIADFAEGAAPRTAILKTCASLKKGGGAFLVEAFHRRAAAKGYERVIHALMHEDNPSVRLSERFGGRVFRRYALWGKLL